jgi:hypothetical protein
MKPPTKEELAARGIDVQTYEAMLRNAASPEGTAMMPPEMNPDMKPEMKSEMKSDMPADKPEGGDKSTAVENEIPPEFLDEVQRDLYMNAKQAKMLLEAAMKKPWWNDVKAGSVAQVLADHKDELPMLDKKPMSNDDLFV